MTGQHSARLLTLQSVSDSTTAKASRSKTKCSCIMLNSTIAEWLRAFFHSEPCINHLHCVLTVPVPFLHADDMVSLATHQLLVSGSVSPFHDLLAFPSSHIGHLPTSATSLRLATLSCLDARSPTRQLLQKSHAQLQHSSLLCEQKPAFPRPVYLQKRLLRVNERAFLGNDHPAITQNCQPTASLTARAAMVFASLIWRHIAQTPDACPFPFPIVYGSPLGLAIHIHRHPHAFREG